MTPLLHRALGLHRLGYAPIPTSSTRVPLVPWKPWQLVRPTEQDVERMFREHPQARGLATVCGKPHGLVVVDADSALAADWLRANLPGTRFTLTRRGLHAHFRHPRLGLVESRSGAEAVEVAPGIKLDIKGFQSVAIMPGSWRAADDRHAAFTYAAAGDWTSPVVDLPELPWAVAKLALAKPPPPPPPPPPRARRDGDDPVRALENYLRKRGGVPEQDKGQGSDQFTFDAAAWARFNAPELREADFVAAIRRERPEFTERWIASKWRSAKGRA